MIGALVAFLAALTAGLLFTPLARRYALRTGMVANPIASRWHREPTALLGGLAIGLASVAGLVVAGVVIAVLIPTAAGTPLPIEPLASTRGLGVAAAATLMFLVGYTDDREWTFFRTKLTMQLVAGTLLVVSGAVFSVTPWPPANLLLTLFWFIGVTNAFNLIDNMDGVAAGVGAIAALTLGVVASRSGAWFHAMAAWALAGAALGFLRYNAHPAKIFMGDVGSLFIGSALAGLLATLPVSTAGTEISRLILCATMVAVPIVDTTLVFTTRTLAGRKFYHGARDHSTHRLARLGLGDRQVAYAAYAVTAIGSAIALANLESDLVVSIGSGFFLLLGLAIVWLTHATRGAK